MANLVSSSGVSNSLLIIRDVLRIVCFLIDGKIVTFLTSLRKALAICIKLFPCVVWIVILRECEIFLSRRLFFTRLSSPKIAVAD